MEKEPNPFPFDDSDGQDKHKVALRLPSAVGEQLKIAVDIWNEMNLALGRKRGRKWSEASVAERFVTLELQAFFKRYGGIPATAEEIAEVTRKAVADVRKLAKLK